MRRLRCVVRGWVRSIWTGLRVSGHDFGPPAYLTVDMGGWWQEWETLACTACGHVSMGWRRFDG